MTLTKTQRVEGGRKEGFPKFVRIVAPVQENGKVWFTGSGNDKIDILGAK